MKGIIAAVMAIMGTTAQAGGPSCGATPAAEYTLSQQYGETVVETMATPSPSDETYVVTWRLWVNHESGSWTLTGTRDDVTCVFRGAVDGYAGQSISTFIGVYNS